MADISGLADLQRQIDAQISGMRTALPVIVQQAADDVKAEIDPRMPQDTGRLESSLEDKVTSKADSASAIVQVSGTNKDGRVHYGIFKEFGTVNMPATPFFRPGVAAGIPIAQNRILSALGALVMKS